MPNRPNKTIYILLVLSLLCSASALAQVPELKPIDSGQNTQQAATVAELVMLLKRQLPDLTQLRATEFSSGSVTDLIARVEIAQRRHAYRNTMAKLQSAIDRRADGRTVFAPAQRQLEQLLVTDSLVIRQELEQQSEGIMRLMDGIGLDNPEAQVAAAARLRVEIPEEDVLLQDFERNISLRSAAGRDINDDLANLKQRLIFRGQIQAGILRTITIALNSQHGRPVGFPSQA